MRTYLHKEDRYIEAASNLRDIILGGQDGLVNVLGVVLAVAAATQDIKIILLAGLAATFAESISMAAVGYTSSKAAKQYYQKHNMKDHHEMEEWKNPLKNALVIGVASIIGSLIPLITFMFLEVRPAMVGAVILSALVLFASGYSKNKMTTGSPMKGGFEMAAIGIFAALAGYVIGAALGVVIYA